MSEISYQPKKDYKKYIFISLAVLFSLGVIIFLVLTVKQKNSDLKNSDDSANQQDSDEKVLSPEEATKALGDKLPEDQVKEFTKEEADSSLSGTPNANQTANNIGNSASSSDKNVLSPADALDALGGK